MKIFRIFFLISSAIGIVLTVMFALSRAGLLALLFSVLWIPPLFFSDKLKKQIAAGEEWNAPTVIRIVIGVILSAILLYNAAEFFLAFTGSSGSQPVKVSQVPVASQMPAVSQAPAAKPSPQVFRIGDVAEIGGVRIGLLGAQMHHGNAYTKPKDGHVFVVAEFDVQNNSGEQINISSFFGSEAYCDGYLTKQSFTAEISDPRDRDGLTGSIPDGKKLRGIIGYELPEDWEELEISIQTDWWKGSSSDAITFVIHAS